MVIMGDLKRCKHPGCNFKTSRTYCIKHQIAIKKEPVQMDEKQKELRKMIEAFMFNISGHIEQAGVFYSKKDMGEMIKELDKMKEFAVEYQKGMIDE